MKLIKNWGWGIAYLYSAFALAMIAVLIFATFHQSDLVETNYYEKEIKYQQDLDKIKRSENYQNDFNIEKIDSMLILNYPKYISNFINGTAMFYCTSDSKKDFTIPVSINSAKMQYVPLSAFCKGLWKIKIDFFISDSTFYLEKNFIID